MGDPGVGSGAAPMLAPLKLLLSKGADPDLGDPEANPTIPATPLNLICNQLRQAAATARSTCSPASGKLTYPRVLPISS